jgi:hypothetical protein
MCFFLLTYSNFLNCRPICFHHVTVLMSDEQEHANEGLGQTLRRNSCDKIALAAGLLTF